MIERKLKVSGTVQTVGYRDIVRRIALEYKVVGHVKNLPDMTVEVVCQGKKKQLEKFMDAIDVKEEFVNVKDVEIIEDKEIEKTTTDLFRIEYGDLAEEFGERMNQGMWYMRDNQKTSKEILGAVRETHGAVTQLSEKTDRGFKELGEKMDKVGDKVDTVGDKVDTVGDKVDTLGDKVDNLTDHTDRNFQMLDSKYHVISEKTGNVDSNLSNLTDEIRNLSRNIENLVRAFIEKESRE